MEGVTDLSKNAFITGITGQDGTFLSELLLSKGYKVWGLVRRSSHDDPIKRIELITDKKVHLRYGDMTDPTSIQRILEECKPDEIYNLAAQSHVRISYDCPKYTADVNATGVVNLLHSAHKIVPESRIYQACHDTETLVVAKKGIVPYTELSVGDKVYTYNVNTRRMELKPIEAVHIYDYDGEMVVIKGKRIDQKVTPNHHLLVRFDSDRFANYVKAEDLQHLLPYERSSSVSLVVPEPTFEAPNDIDLKTYVDPSKISNNHYKNLIWNMLCEDFMYLLGIYIGDGFIKSKKSRVKGVGVCSNRGADGRFTYINKAPSVEKLYESSYITFAVPKTDSERLTLVNVLKNNDIDFQEHDDGISFSSFTLSEVFRQCGTSAYDKCIPSWVWELPDSALSHLKKGMLGSDGHVRKTNKRESYCTSSFRLVRDTVILSYRLGLYCSYSMRYLKKSMIKCESRVINARPNWIVSFNQKCCNKIYRERISRVPYVGKVWCLQMEDNKNFLVVRNGKIAFSGNSTSEMFGRSKPPQNEETSFKPTSPYGSAKLHAYWEVVNCRVGLRMFASNGILFNHESERRGENFVTRKITIAVAKILLGLQKTLYLGNLDAKRDWGYAADYVRAMWLMLQHDTPDDFVIATGKANTVRTFVETAFALVGIPVESNGKEGLDEKYIRTDTGDVVVEIDPRFYRPVEVDYLLGDASKAYDILGWKSEVTFEELVGRMVTFDLDRLGSHPTPAKWEQMNA